MKAYNPPDLTAWRGLYAAAERIKTLAPWTFMTETDIFGVRDPETGITGFVSVMGMRKEHFAITVYPNEKTLAVFVGVQESVEPVDPDIIMEMPQIQAAFEDRDFVRSGDLKIIRSLGLKFRGGSGWPVFRSYRPGYIPWFLEAEEVRLLTQALEQTLDVAPRFRMNPYLLRSGNRTAYLVRSLAETPAGRMWKDEIVEIALPAETAETPYSDEIILSAVGKLPSTKSVSEADVFISFIQVGPKGKRPENPYVLLLVEAESRYILGLHILTAGNSLGEMRRQAAAEIFQALLKAGIRPGEIRLKSKPLAETIRPACERCGIRVRIAYRLPVLEEIKRDFSETMMGHGGPKIGS